MFLEVNLTGLWKPYPLGKMQANMYGFGRVSYHLLFFYHIQHSLSRNYSGTVLCFSQVTSKYSDSFETKSYSDF